MSASFVDTNVLVYAYDDDEPQKRDRARALLAELGAADEIVVSTQVLQEFYVTVTRKLARPLAEDDADRALQAWAQLPVVHIDVAIVLTAARVSRAHSLSFWDALIIEAARARGCDRVLSEDMQDGYDLDGVVVHNPFND